MTLRRNADDVTARRVPVHPSSMQAVDQRVVMSVHQLSISSGNTECSLWNCGESCAQKDLYNALYLLQGKLRHPRVLIQLLTSFDVSFQARC